VFCCHNRKKELLCRKKSGQKRGEKAEYKIAIGLMYSDIVASTILETTKSREVMQAGTRYKLS
jgi:hypothetical protein